MNCLRIVFLFIFVLISVTVFPQSEAKSSITTEWVTISMGKLQKKPRFKEPMISVKFIQEENVQYMHLSLKYMFTDAVFEEAVPVEYYKNERIEFVTEKGKNELRAVKYAKARRMASVAQKTADIRVIFSGSLSFMRDNLIKSFTVHFAQGYQNIDINTEEAVHMRDVYNKFISMLPATKLAEESIVKIEGEKPKSKQEETKSSDEDSLEKLRKQAKKWGR
ncbi:MAG: hypothetical protein LBV43_09925 [Prevotella sp.]|jgi:hypothetical protein|nr:hypothetical protein [Prevotella sp.]